jgi:hypothetical protein
MDDERIERVGEDVLGAGSVEFAELAREPPRDGVEQRAAEQVLRGVPERASFDLPADVAAKLSEVGRGACCLGLARGVH